MLVFSAGIHKMFFRIANREYPDQTASSRSSLIWVCTACLRLFMQSTSIRNLEHLPYLAFCSVTAPAKNINVCLFVLLLYVPSQQLWSW